MNQFLEFSGSLLKERREQSGFTRSGLAESLGVSAQIVYDWETGRKKPGLDNLRALGSVFGVHFY